MADDQRHLALGVQAAIFRTFGAIPGVLVYGALFDDSCVYWKSECGRHGNCILYDNDKLGIRLFSVTIASVVVALVLLFLSWFLYPKKQVHHEK